MSLSKQLLILISALFLLIFGVNLISSIDNTRTYLENESQSHAQDTATSLGLSLSSYMKAPNDPTVKAMVSAIFDMGYYGEIRLLDANQNEIVKLINNKQAEGVPVWFIELLPMSPAAAESEITSGWTISGTVYVSVNPAYAYSSLYQQAEKSLLYSLITLALSMLMLSLLLRFTLAPLNRINQLAQQIANGQFKTIEQLPWTVEVRNVAMSMNTMSQKIKGVIVGLNAKLETTGAKLLRDELSGLFKKSVFESDVKRLIMEQNAAFICLMKVDTLPELVKEHGNDAIDQLLRDFSALIQKQLQNHAEIPIKAYRFYGGEFAILAETDDLNRIELLCENLSSDITKLGPHYGKTDLAHIGASPVSLDTLENTVSAAHEAYEQARLIGANGYYIRPEHRDARDLSAWKTLVFDCIDNTNYCLTYTGATISFDTQQTIMEEAFTKVIDKQGNSVPIAPFISIAEKYAKIIDLDKGVIRETLRHIQSSGIPHAIAVNLSTRSIKNAEFLSWFETLFKNNPVVADQLVFSFSAYAVSKDVNTYENFFDTLHQWGGRAMIKRFEPQSITSETNKQLKPNFVRLAREIGNGISTSHKKHDFVETIQEMAKLLDIAVLAENVRTDEDYNTLKRIGIKGASR